MSTLITRLQPTNQNTQPTVRPFAALLEGLERYLPRYLPHADTRNGVAETNRFVAERNEREVQQRLDDLRSFLVLAQQKAKTVLVFQDLEKAEVENGSPQLGYHRIEAVCSQLGITPISLEPYFRQQVKSGVYPYQDNIHPNKTGQRATADTILANVPSE